MLSVGGSGEGGAKVESFAEVGSLNNHTTGLIEYVLPHFKTQTEIYIEAYLENRILITDLINDLITWIEGQLSINEYITLIGL